MLNLLELILALTGILLLVGLVANYMNKDSEWAPRLRGATGFLAKLSGIVLALFVMGSLYTMTGGQLGFEQVGVYVACVAIIISSWRDLMSSSEFASNLATVAVHRAASAQEDIARRAAHLSEEAKQLSIDAKEAQRAASDLPNSDLNKPV